MLDHRAPRRSAPVEVRRPHPDAAPPWPAVALTLGAAAILATVGATIGHGSPKPTAWWGHTVAAGLLVLAAGMALGAPPWQRRGINVAAWVMGYSLGLGLMTLWGVGAGSLLATIVLGGALLLWPHGRGEAPVGWTQVWYECLGFLGFFAPLLLLAPTIV